MADGRLLYTFGSCHGLAEEWTTNELRVKSLDLASPPEMEPIAEAGAELYIIAAVADLTAELDACISKMREENPSGVLGIILLAEDFGGFECKNLTAHLHQYIENVDMCVFATTAENEQIVSVFLNQDSITAGVSGMDIAGAMIAFPRLHFFTLLNKEKTTCGQDVPDGSLLFSSAKIGADAPVCDEAKFGPRCFIQRDEKPLHFVNLPGDGTATVVMCLNVLTDIFKKAVDAGFEEGDGDEMEHNEAKSNVNDLISEYEQYGKAPE